MRGGDTATLIGTLIGTDPEGWASGDADGEGEGLDVPEHASVSGEAIVLGGGILEVAGREIILSGISAPRDGAECKDADGEIYDCAAWATEGMATYIDGRKVFCSVSAVEAKSYGLCEAEMDDGGPMIDVASWMVSAGIAVASDVPAPSLYTRMEEFAKEKKVGIWAGTFSFDGHQGG